MAIILSEEMVQVRFTVREEDGSEFTDALYLTVAQRAAIAPEALEEMKVDRYERWKAALALAADTPVEIEQTEKDLLSDIVVLEEQRAAIDAQLAEKNAELALVVAKIDTDPIVVKEPRPASEG